MRKKFILVLSFIVPFLITWIGCENDYPDSLFDPNYKGNPTPIISKVTPPDVGYAAVEEVIIEGQNFSPIPEDNYVYFGKYKVSVKTANTTKLVVTAPNVQSDSLGIKVAVKGAIQYSNIIKYKLLPAFIEFGDYTKLDDPYGIESDVNGNLYVALSLGTTGKIEKITPTGVKSDYGTFTFSIANSLKFGPDGGLYLTRLIPIIYRIPPGGGAATTYVTLPSSGRAQDIDFDKDGNMWAVGNNQFVYKIKSDKSIKTYPFVANLKGVKIFNDYLYVVGKDPDGKEKVWRAQIKSNDELGSFEVYFDFASKYSSASYSIAIANDGTIYIGTDGADNETIIAINTDKSSAPLYSGFLKSKSYYLSWGSSSSLKYLFVSRRNDNPELRKIMKIYMAKDGAPYYGRK